MVNTSAFWAAAIVCAIAALLSALGCATPQVTSVRYYKPVLKSYAGTLMADQVAHDLDFEKTCAPVGDDEGRCVIMLAPDFFEFKRQCSEAYQSLDILPPEMDSD